MAGIIGKVLLISIALLAITAMVNSMCNNPRQIVNGRWNATFRRHKLETGVKWEFSCFSGYSLVGSRTMTCQPNGQWSSDVPNCVKGRVGTNNGHIRNFGSESSGAFCPKPMQIMNGRWDATFITNYLESGAVWKFRCFDGFNLVGSNSMTCDAQGRWTSEVPSCVRDTEPVDSTSSTSLLSSFCQDPGLPQGSRRVAYFTKNELETGAKMVFSCDEGFKMEGSDTTICLPTKEWSSPVPNCLRDDVDTQASVPVSAYPTLTTTCEDPGVPSNSIRSPLVSQFKLGSLVNYTCNAGFDLQGTSSLVCMYSGKWSSSPPECIGSTEKDSCKEPEPPKNGKLRIIISRREPNTPIKLTVGSQIQYACEANYHLDGPDTRECLNQGQWSGPEPRCVINCGTSKGSQISFIINGEVSKLGQWPWQAGIALDGKLLQKIFPKQAENLTFATSDGSRGIICGGSLISDEWVMTAAHCVTVDRTTEKYPIGDISVYIGKQFRDPAKDDDFVQWSRVTDISVHEDFNRKLLIADIAMIRMEKLAKFSDRVLPICLPISSQSIMNDGGRGVVSGWGTTEGNVLGDQLKHGELTLADASKCEQVRRGQSPTEASRIQKDQFCANAVAIDSGYSCLGDSGGPLVFHETVDGQKKWVIQGIVSWGIPGCAVSASAYIRVNFYMNWLRRFVEIDGN